MELRRTITLQKELQRQNPTPTTPMKTKVKPSNQEDKVSTNSLTGLLTTPWTTGKSFLTCSQVTFELLEASKCCWLEILSETSLRIHSSLEKRSIFSEHKLLVFIMERRLSRMEWISCKKLQRKEVLSWKLNLKILRMRKTSLYSLRRKTRLYWKIGFIFQKGFLRTAEQDIWSQKCLKATLGNRPTF